MLTFSNRSNALFALLALALAATTLAATPSRSQDYPARPVELIVPFAAGGGAELLARLLSEGLNKRFGQAFLVINRPGANTNLGTLSVVRAKPDGYTLAIASVGLTANPSLYKSLAFEPQRDLDPITLIANSPTVLVVPPSLPVNTLPEFMDLARRTEIRWASGGIGTSQHLAGEYFTQMSGLKMVHVPYRGTGPALNDLAAGIVDAYFGDPATLGVIKGGKARAMAVTSPERWPVLPDTPALAEALPGYEAWNWYGIDAPPGTPDAIVDRLSTAILKVMADPEVKKKYDDNGLHPANLSRADYLAFIKRDSAVWAQVIAKGNIRAEE